MVIVTRRVSVKRRWCVVASVLARAPMDSTGRAGIAWVRCGCRRADRGSRANTRTLRPVVTGTKAFSRRRQNAFPRTSCRNLRRPRFNLRKDARCRRTSQCAPIAQQCRLSSTARRDRRGVAPASNSARRAQVRLDARVGDIPGSADSGCHPSRRPNTRRLRGQYGVTGLPHRQARRVPLPLHFPFHCSGHQARWCEES
jgi:hypothetical protein